MTGTKLLRALAAAAALAAPTAAPAQDYFIGEIITVGFNFCPRGTAPLDGQLLAISSNDALFALVGTIYGGDGRTSFGLPEARGRRLMGQGNGPGLTPRREGQRAGTQAGQMTVATMASHNHDVRANNLDGDKPGPGGKLLAAAPDEGTGTETIYSDHPPNRTMSAEMIAPTGGGTFFPIQDPYLGMTHCIVLQGIFPSRN